MRRRRTLLAVLILLLAGGGLVGGLGLLLKRDPPDYLKAVPARADDSELAAAFIIKSSDFRTNLRLRPDWSSTFSADEVNAFLRDQLDGRDTVYGVPVSAPRVVPHGDKLLLAARLGDGPLSTVLSLEVRAWLVGAQPNTVAVELGGLQAGRLPVGSHWLMDRLSDAVREYNTEVTWYRHEGRPVGLFRLYADQARPATRLRGVTVGNGGVTLAGRTTTTESGVVTP